MFMYNMKKLHKACFTDYIINKGVTLSNTWVYTWVRAHIARRARTEVLQRAVRVKSNDKK